QTFFRTTTQPVQVGDTAVPENQKVLMFLGSANRDPRRWTNPDTFDLDRDPSGHVAFGRGVHQCVGQHVARLEASCVLEAMVERVAKIEFAAPPKRKINNTLLGWQTLPLRLNPAYLSTSILGAHHVENSYPNPSTSKRAVRRHRHRGPRTERVWFCRRQ